MKKQDTLDIKPVVPSSPSASAVDTFLAAKVPHSTYLTKNIEESWAVNAKNKELDDLEYQNWFNGTNSIEETVSSGFIDFSHKIFTQELYQYLGNPQNKTSLEIGFGGGRLMIPAARYFKKVIGVDIHNSFKKTSQFLEKNGCKNYELVHRDNSDSIYDETIDFIYSFIVFQHFKDWKEVEKYFSFFKRVMRPGSVAKIYFKDLPEPTPPHLILPKFKDELTYKFYTPGRVYEEVYEPSSPLIVFQLKDYLKSGAEEDIDIRSDTTHAPPPKGVGSFSSLFTKPQFVVDALIHHGFKILQEPTFLTKRPWDLTPSSQFFITFMKE